MGLVLQNGVFVAKCFILLASLTCSVSGLPTDCGVAALNPSEPRTNYVQARGNRIVGGRQAARHSWPWQAAVMRDGVHVCGGALIHPNFVATAAHCVAKRPDAWRYKVVLGAHARFDGRWHSVKRVVVHALFDKFMARSYDYALLQLVDNATLGERVGLVCLPTVGVAHGRSCVVTGWGKMSEGGAPAATLHEARVPIVAEGICNDPRHYFGMIHIPTMLCAGYDEGGVDACQGDSGGPLVCAVAGKWQLMGLVSWGFGCALPNNPGVYSKVITANGWFRHQIFINQRL